MSLAIFWTKEAKETFDATLNFIESKWGEKEVKKFLQRSQNTILNISKYPYLFKASEIEVNVRKGLISKQISVFYLIEDDRIVILYFWDNRQEPIL
ncbi:MAG: type II toxin-antitoxin system RelE/ParE family toxin [Pelobium sp.]